jgi:hypothetical protein
MPEKAGLSKCDSQRVLQFGKSRIQSAFTFGNLFSLDCAHFKTTCLNGCLVAGSLGGGLQAIFWRAMNPSRSAASILMIPREPGRAILTYGNEPEAHSS